MLLLQVEINPKLLLMLESYTHVRMYGRGLRSLDRDSGYNQEVGRCSFVCSKLAPKDTNPICPIDIRVSRVGAEVLSIGYRPQQEPPTCHVDQMLTKLRLV